MSRVFCRVLSKVLSRVLRIMFVIGWWHGFIDQDKCIDILCILSTINGN